MLDTLHPSGPSFEDNSQTIMCPVTRLPPEISHTILDLALPPSFLITPVDSTSRAFDGPWRRAMTLKLSMLLVSKAWHAAVLRLLFADVFLKNAIQADTFYGSLNSTMAPPSTEIARFVRSIDFKQRDSSLQHCLSRYVEIRSSCPKLQHIGLRVRRPRNHTITLISALSITSLTIRVNVYGAYGAADLIGALRAAAETTTHLHLYLVSFNGVPTDYSSYSSDSEDSEIDTDRSVSRETRHITFPHLHELEFTFTPDYDDVIELMELWLLPQLRQLTYHSQDSVLRYFSSPWEFVRRYKSQIQYLNIDIQFKANAQLVCHNIRELLEELVSLSHLVLHTLPDEKALKSMSVEFIDIWQRIAPDPNSDPVTQNATERATRLRGGARTKQHARKSTGAMVPRNQIINGPPHHAPISGTNVFPKLRQVRILDKTLRYLSHLPLDIPPDRVLSREDEFNMKYDGIHIRHDVGKLVRVREGTDEEEVPEESDEDNDY